jgi:hypothetical protein
MPHEVVRIDLREIHRERLHDRRVEAVSRNRGQSIPEPHQPLRCRVRAKYRDRMRLERQNDGSYAAMVCIRSYLVENDGVAAVNAIEVADGDYGARKVLETAKNPQTFAVRKGLSLPSAGASCGLRTLRGLRGSG